MTMWALEGDAHLPDVSLLCPCIIPQVGSSDWFLSHLSSPGICLGPSSLQHDLEDVSGLGKQ